MRPGVDVISRALPPPRSAPTDTGVAFIVGATAEGNGVSLVQSMTEYVAVLGDRSAVAGEQATYDAADVYFREGGNKLWVSRTNPGVGTFAAPESLSADDMEGMTRSELIAYANEEGVDTAGWSNTSKADIIAALQAQTAPTPMLLDPTIVTALDAFTKDLGPGQVFIADPLLAADAANQSALLAHAAACNRVALLSCPDGTSAQIIAAGEALQLDANSRYGALYAPSATVPGVVAGTTRTVPYTAVQAGILSRNDVSYSPNQAAAGDLGQSLFALDVAGHFTDQEYHDLNEASVAMARLIYGGVRTYGTRSCVDPVAVPQWRDFGWVRLNMALVAEAEAIGEHYVFTQIDGRGHTLADFSGDLSAMLAGYYDDGSLYGATPEEAYSVDVGGTVNTPETIANGELHAVMAVRMSPNAEWVVIEIVKVASNQALPGTVASAA